MSIEPTKDAKQPIRYDDHTDTTRIELYYMIDTRVGKPTCQASCEFCWMKRPHLKDFVQSADDARRVIKLLRDQGYHVSPMVSDTFGEKGHYLRSGLFSNGDVPEGGFYGGNTGNAAWSSGRPLLGDNYRELLQGCIENNIRSIAMTAHGTEDRELEFKGITQPSVVKEAVRRIRSFTEETGWQFEIMLTFTLSARNNDAGQIERYLAQCDEMTVDVARFNRFADIQQRYLDMRMSPAVTAETYRTMKEVYEAHVGRVQMSISEDFGSWGVEQMGFPETVGHCVAGERLFGVVYPYVYLCPVNLTLVAGEIDENGVIHWDEAVKQRLAKAKQHEDFGGCIGVAYPHSQPIRDMFADLPRHGEPIPGSTELQMPRVSLPIIST